MKKFFKNNKDNIIIFLIPFVIFCILLVTFFPGIVTYDGNFQWLQVESGLLNNAHPFLSTYFMFLLSKIWNSISMVSIFQIFLFSYTWSLLCKEIRHYNSKNPKIFKFQILITTLVSFLPIISLYSITIWKDILYSYYLMLIILLIYKGIKNNFDYGKLDYFNFGFLLAMIYGYRFNGKIVAVLLLISILIIILKKKIKLKNYVLILTVFIGLNFIISIPQKYYENKYIKYLAQQESKNDETLNTIDGYIAWMYGAFISDDVIKDKNILSELDKIIPLDKWKEIYDPFLINSTGTCEKNAHYYNEHMDYYRKTFIKLCFKHPLTIIKHYLKADALLWCPFDVGYIYSFDYTSWWPDYEFNNAKLYKYKELSLKMPILKKIVEKYTSFGLYFPMRLFYRPVNVLIVSIFLLFLLIKQNKNKKYWLLLIPALSNIVSLLPINLAQDLRYVYINYLTFIFVILLFCCEYNFAKISNKLRKGKK